MIDISSLKDKKNNAKQEDYIKENKIPANEHLTAREFIEKVVEPIIELQNESKRNVRSIVRNGQEYLPVDGVVTLPSDETTVSVLCENRIKNIVSIDGTLNVKLAFTSVQGGSNTFEIVDVEVRAFRNGAYTTIGKFSAPTSDIEFPEYREYNLSDYGLSAGTYENLIVQATGKRTTVSGVYQFTKIVSTTLSLSLNRNYYTPIMAEEQAGRFPINYTVYGAIQKNLNVRVKGSEGMVDAVYALGPDVDASNIQYNIQDTSGLLSHGVKEVEAWLTCDDGMGGTLSSDHIVNRFMVVNPQTEGVDFTKPHLLLQNIVKTASNFVQTTLCDYAVFSPKIYADGSISNDGETVDVTFLLTDFSENYGEWRNEYFRIETQVKPGVGNQLKTTVEIEGGINDEDVTSYNAYLRVIRKGKNDTEIDFLFEAQGVDTISIEVDNKDSFAPYRGSDFLLNPKVRNNSEANPQRILNARNNNVEVKSTWSGFGMISDGWVSDSEGNKVLRIPAGGRINFEYNPFAQFFSTPDSSMTLEIDCAMRNVSNETDCCIAINEIVEATAAKLGLFIMPIHGAIYTASNQSESECDFFWEEEKRNHIAINICNAIVPNRGDALVPANPESDLDINATQIALVRVLVNGVIKREMKFSTSNRTEFCTSATSHGGITLGQDGCDLDIYSIRCYRQMSLSAEDVFNNMISTIPTAEGKIAKRYENAITTGGKIDIEKVKAHGRRVLIWHGKEPFKYATDGQKGWWEIHQYKDDLTEDLEYSGTICKETASIQATRQGSTANTYYYSNLQTKTDKPSKITIPLSMLHKSIQQGPVTDEKDENGNITGQVIWLLGGNLGALEPNVMSFNDTNYTKNCKSYAYSLKDGIPYVKVPDGWIDGNNKYRGMGFCLAEGTPQALKLVNKINYASSMQSHLPGVCRMYSDLHTLVVGKNSMQEACDTARVAKFNLPFYFFTQEEGGDVKFRGGCAFGGGKMDKPTWGYVKKQHPLFTMIEGSDNNYDLTDFRVPFDKNDVRYKPEDEGWFYNGLQQWDFDAGATNEDTEYQDKDGNNYEYPKDNIVEVVRNMINFVYLHSPNLSYFSGSFTDFIRSSRVNNTTKKVWCTSGSDAFCVKRWREFRYIERYVNDEGDTVETTRNIAEWVDAGLAESEYQLTNAKGQPLYYVGRYSDVASTNVTAFPVMQSVFAKVDLRQDEMTKAAYDGSTNKTQFAQLNTQFINAIVQHARKYIGWYFKPASCKFHYCFVNHLMAGTDNCSKNTYFCIDPKAVEVEIDGEKRTCYLFEMHQDDVDTVIPTDNNGRTTKPYYVDRMNPYPDGSSTSCYEGMNNQLFNLIEQMWEGTKELQSTMKNIFSAMSSLVNSTDVIPGMEDSSSKVSVWGFFNKYLFSINRYFAEMAFNEQARIRYEYPAMINFTSRGSGARGVAPITQSMGNALESELQWMKQRLIYVGSYAAWGPFYDNKSGELGVGGATDTFSMQMFHLPHEDQSNNSYKFTVRPTQYIYPTGMMGQTVVDPHYRVKPGQDYVLDLGSGTSNDTGISVNAINFYLSIGNIGDLSTTPANTITVNGKRLTEFTAEPTKLYRDAETGEMVPAFRPSSIAIAATNIKRLSLKGCKQIGATIDASRLTRLEEIDLRETNIFGCSLPNTSTLTTVKYPDKFTYIELENLENLSSLTFEDVKYLEDISIKNCPKLNTLAFVSMVMLLKKLSDNKPISSLVMLGVDWKQTDINIVKWIVDIDEVDMTGIIEIKEENQFTPSVDLAFKTRLIEKFGNIDDETSEDYRGLKIIYRLREISNVEVTGNFYNNGREYYQFGISATPTSANALIKVEWEVTSPTLGGECYIDNFGRLYVKKISLSEDYVTVSATVHTYFNGVYNTIAANKRIRIYDREAHLGDYVFADGTFSDELDPSKTVVGICFYIAPTDSKGDIIPTLFNPNDKMKRLMVSVNSISYSSFSTWQWGAYLSGVPDDAKNELYSTEANGTKVGLTCPDAGLDTTSKFFDIQSIVNLGTNGLSTLYITDDTLRDEVTTEGVANSGFKVFNANTAAGDGFAWGETESQQLARTLTPELARLAGSEYHDGDMVNRGYANTLKIIAHRNSILNAGVPQVAIGSLGIPQASQSGGTTELADLVNLMELLRNNMQNNGEANYAKWIQLYWPAASAAYAYEPTVLKTGEQLSEKFKAHNWFLPTRGMLDRLYWYYSKGAIGSQNIFREAISKNIFANFSISGHWSSTELNQPGSWFVNFSSGNVSNGLKSNSYVVRAVAAF